LKPVIEQFQTSVEPAPALAWTSGGYERNEDTAAASVPRLAK
jgi:hypothetical protein